MPVNVGRKPGFQQRTRPTEPSVLIDRITDDNQIPTSGSYSLDLLIQERNLRKCLNYNLRTNLHRSVSRCHGNCGKTILPEQEGMLIKSFGTTTWTDAKTGAEKSKFDPHTFCGRMLEKLRYR